MGHIPGDYPELGEYSVEVRRESFYLKGEESYEEEGRHALCLYPSSPDRSHNQGTAELLIEDLDKLRCALDLVDWIDQQGERGEPYQGVIGCWELHLVWSDREHELLARVRTHAQAKRLLAAAERAIAQPEHALPEHARLELNSVPLTRSARLMELLETDERLQQEARVARTESNQELILRAFAAQTPVSFVIVEEDEMRLAVWGEPIQAVDLKQGLFQLEASDQPLSFQDVYYLSEGEDERLKSLPTLNPSLEELEELLGEPAPLPAG